MDPQLTWLIPLTFICLVVVVRGVRAQKRHREDRAALMRRLGFLDRSDRTEELESLVKTFGRIEATAFSKRLDGVTIWQALDYDSEGPGAPFWGAVFHREAGLPPGVTLVSADDAYTRHALLMKSVDFLMKATGLAHSLPVPPAGARFKAYAKSPTWPAPVPSDFWSILSAHPHPLRVEFHANAIKIIPIATTTKPVDPLKESAALYALMEKIAAAFGRL